MITDTDMKHLRRCVELAAESLANGDDPFGSLIVSGQGEVLAEARNQVSGGDQTRHPEFELARWAAANMTPEARRDATVYTSGALSHVCGSTRLGRTWQNCLCQFLGTVCSLEQGTRRPRVTSSQSACSGCYS